VLALTATATPRVQGEIADNLDLRNPFKFAHSIVRNNLHLNATWVTNSLKPRLCHTRKVITAATPGTPGIVYCRFRGLTLRVAYDLSRNGIPAAFFHAGLSAIRKADTQNQFMNNQIQIAAATIALGMGLNKSDIRLVIHSGFPSDLTSYVQEIGRAGRDGKVSACHLLYSKGDLMSQIMRPPSDDPKRDHIRIANARALWHFATTKMCRWQFLARYFEESTIPGKCGVCDNCLASIRTSSEIAHISGRVVRRFHAQTHRPKSAIWARAWTIGLVYGRG
jgi:ATP-dependent DNA helicase RecQ